MIELRRLARNRASRSSAKRSCASTQVRPDRRRRPARTAHPVHIQQAPADRTAHHDGDDRRGPADRDRHSQGPSVRHLDAVLCVAVLADVAPESHRAAIVAHTQKTAAALNETINTFHMYMPAGGKPLLRVKSKGARIMRRGVYFDDRKSGCDLVIQKADALRGPSYDSVLTTEVAAYKEAEEFFGGFTPAMVRSKWRTLIRESTAADGYFRDSYESAKRSKTRRAIFLPWWIYPALYSLPLVRRGKKLYDPRTNDVITFALRAQGAKRTLAHASARDWDGPPITDAQMYFRQHEIEKKRTTATRFFNQSSRTTTSRAFCDIRPARSRFACRRSWRPPTRCRRCSPTRSLETCSRTPTPTPRSTYQIIQFEEEPRRATSIRRFAPAC